MQVQTDKKPQDQFLLATAKKAQLQVHSEQPPTKSRQQNHYPEELCEPKIMRGSNSNYDKLMEQLHASPQPNSRSSHLKPKTNRQFRSQITFLSHPGQSQQFIAYCVVIKQSNSGLISHQRFVLVNSQGKEVSYYSHIPELPLKSMHDIRQSPKETIELNKVRSFKVTISKRGIGEVELTWIERNQTKQWRIKMASNQMARDFAMLVEDIKSGKYKQTSEERIGIDKLPESRLQQQKSRVKSSLKQSSASPQSKYLQLSSFSTNIRKSQISSGSKNTHFANLLLKSIHGGQEGILSPKNNQIPEKTQNEKQMGKNSKVEQTSEKRAEAKDFYVQTLPVYNLGPQDNFPLVVENETKNQKMEGIKGDDPKMQTKGELRVFEKVGDSKRSLAMDQIIKDASIQRLEYDQSRNQQYQANIILHKQLIENRPKPSDQQPGTVETKQIHTQMKSLDSDTLKSLQKLDKSVSKLQQLVNSKRHTEEFQESSPPHGIGHSKISVSPITPKIQKKTSNDLTIEGYRTSSHKMQEKTVRRDFQKEPRVSHYRQNLLGERKSQLPQSRMMRPPTMLNQHSHPRRESHSPTEYFSREQPGHWLRRWVSAKSQLQMASVYAAFVEKCKQRVKKLTDKFQNWYLFHRLGETYMVVEEQISLTYTMMNQGQNQQEILEMMGNFEYLLDRSNLLNSKKSKKAARLCVPLACVVVYMGLTVLCKAQLKNSGLKVTLITDTTPYEPLLHSLASLAKIHLQNSQLYSIAVNTQSFVYIEQGDLKISVPTTPSTTVGQRYTDQYVQGVITSEQHLRLIAEHVSFSLARQAAQKLHNFHPLSCLQLADQLESFGLELSALPLLYAHSRGSFLNQLILSELTAESMAVQITLGMHSLLVSKNSRKQPSQQIYSLISSILRLDTDFVTAELSKKGIQISLPVLREALVEQYVMASLLVKLRLSCQLKEGFRLQDVQNLDASFWRQFQINENTIELSFQMGVLGYRAKNFNPRSHQLQAILTDLNQAQSQKQIAVGRIQNALNVSTGEAYHESIGFRLLSVTQKQTINNYLIHLDSLPKKAQPLLAWEEHQQDPYFHLHHFPTYLYYSRQSFHMACQAIRRLVDKKAYSQAAQLLEKQLVRAWVWAKHHPRLLLQIEDLSAVVSMYAGTQNKSLQSCQMSLQIAIKTFEKGQIEIAAVLDSAFKAACFHRSYRLYSKAVEFFTISQSLFEQVLACTTSKSQQNELLSKYVSLFNSKAQLLMEMGSFHIAEQHLLRTLDRLLKMKAEGAMGPSGMSLIADQQFEAYSLLFRVYQLTAKKMEMLKLMEACSVKYLQNQIQLLINLNKPLHAQLDSKTHKYARQTLKNVWIALLSNCQHWSRSTAVPSPYCLQLSRVELSSIRSVVLQLKKANKGNIPFTQKQVMLSIFETIARRMQKQKITAENLRQKECNSILIMILSDCLGVLSELSQQGNTSVVLLQMERREDLSMLEKLFWGIGWQLGVGVLDEHLRAYETDM